MSRKVRVRHPQQVRLVSLGCSKNFVDSELIAGGLVTSGFILTSSENADVMLINTCAFIRSARAELEEKLDEAFLWRAEHSKVRKVVVAGCAVSYQNPEERLAGLLSEVDLRLSPADIPAAGRLLRSLLSNDSSLSVAASSGWAPTQDAQDARLQLTPRHYAYLKISDGCDNHCAYCSIPSIRGPLRSRPLDSILEEARNLLGAGVRELILIAQDSTAYGADLAGGRAFRTLLERLDCLEGDFWIRAHYLHPAGMDDSLLDLLMGGRHVIPYLDMPLQHATDKVLELMGRRPNVNAVRRILEGVRTRNPLACLRTTFIVGFPGEDDADFAALMEFVNEWRFDMLGAFVYQPEKETRASSLPFPVSTELAMERMDILMERQKMISSEKNAFMIGRTLRTIVDGEPGPGQTMSTRSFRDSPEVDNTIWTGGLRRKDVGSFVDVLVDGADAYDLTGQAVRR